MDRLDAMRQFVSVAELGSFSGAAKQLGLARSIVTRHVAALEAHLGTKLLARSTRRLSLTAAGNDYLEKCRVILNLVEAAESGAAAERQVPRGRIRVSVPISFGRRFLGPLFLEFVRRYPEVSLDIDYVDRRSNLIEEGIDLAVRITLRLEPGTVARRLGSSRMVVAAAPQYLDKHGEPHHPADLVHHECLGYTGTTSPGSWEFLVDGKPRAFPIRSRLQANNGEALTDAAIAGFGIVLSPQFIVGDALAGARLRQTLAAYPLAEVGIFGVLPSHRHVPHRVRALLDFIAEGLAAARAEPPPR